MKYYSTKNKDLKFSFKDAVIKGLAPDGGLFYPKHLPQLNKSFIDNLHNLSLAEIGFEVAKHFMGGDIPTNKLKEICDDSLNFPTPLVSFEPSVYSMELFHGPSCAFKDVGARFMSRCLSHFAQESDEKITILAATSGDTGSAVANGFLGIENIEVVILYPSGKVSQIQEQQLTTLGNNITALEIDGSFDDCQALVKQAFQDKDLNKKMKLSSANSINIARLIPQSFYYFYAYGQLKNQNKNLVISVPSGNYGNLTAGLIAKQMGLPIKRFIASTNVNKVVPDYLNTGKYESKASIPSISNAMDVGAPSNFDRMMTLYQENHPKICEDLKGASFNDEQTKEIMRKVYKDFGYILDPHGAVAYLGLQEELDTTNELGVFIETAHPAKFIDIVEEVIETQIDIPNYLKSCLTKEKISIQMPNDYQDFKTFLES
ncbi:threonine synthase [Ancylomarina euxinus]|uniref:Threonine synthase n=1 Tax=Ancylomarina euxinus TaxID=2283627 RepID=A0A425Y1T3_9BACT|nr:threonine synthase [Ancylomarina euxinus]MCZ4695185.1 threonine synthase [Ancylomarina euxinus]MUP14881.1 threonine synthase [Ancylomarina euxinus]RRG21776.1 threonine synthase [Ancylomarina euxinus]